ncbi:MAG: DHHW family protein [bacterium]|jgi:hypothetical protein
MNRAGRITITIMFLAVIFGLPVLTKLQPNPSVSLTENRRLATPPVYSPAALLSGDYFREWETFLSDHIFARDIWIKTYTSLNLYGLGKRQINNIVIGREGYLLPFHSYTTGYDRESHAASLWTMTGRIARLAAAVEEYGGSYYFIGVPEQSSFHRDKYPAYFLNNAERLNASEEILLAGLAANGVAFINLREVFATAEEEYYYKTDHHYNFAGALATYRAVIGRLQTDGRIGETPLGPEEIQLITLAPPFAGTRNRQLYHLYPVREKLQIGYLTPEIAYTKSTNWEENPELYDLAPDAAGRISYSVYMGGDNAETVIRTGRPDRPNLLLFGDSFTNAVEPLLYYHFNETRIVDLRHYRNLNLYGYVAEHRPDIVLMLRDDLNYATLDGNGDFGGE